MHRRLHNPPGHATVVPVTPLHRLRGAWDTVTSIDPGGSTTNRDILGWHDAQRAESFDSIGFSIAFASLFAEASLAAFAFASASFAATMPCAS